MNTMKSSISRCCLVNFVLWVTTLPALGVAYRYPVELPVNSLKLEIEERYFTTEERHMGSLLAQSVPAKQIRDSRPFEAVILHIRNNDNSDYQVVPLASSHTKQKGKLELEIESVTFWWKPEIPGAKPGEAYPCYISYEAGEKKWTTREFSIRIGGKGRHAHCNHCFSIGMAPTVSLTDITAARINALSGEMNPTTGRGSMERGAAARVGAVSSNGRLDATAGSLERSSARRMEAVVASRDGQGMDVKLHSSIRIYSLQALPRAEVIGQLQAGVTVHIISEINPKLLHVRFTVSSGRTFEGVARYADLGVQRMAGLPKNIDIPEFGKLTMVWCPPGAFTMGSPAWEQWRDDDEIPHEVTLTQGFWMSQFEVTQGLWESVMGNNDSSGEPLGPQYPAIDLSWEDCNVFCDRLRQKTGLPFRLPTEAEWEYACRAGSSKAWGEGGNQSDAGWFMDNSNGKLHLPGEKKGNAWGLFDMLGNVEEWCSDWYGEYPLFAVTNPKGPDTGERRVTRGGDYKASRTEPRCANRLSWPPEARLNTGMRLVLEGD